MRLFVLPDRPRGGNRVTLNGQDHHYLARVRRVKVGDRFPGTDGRGGSWLCTVERITSSSTLLLLDAQPGRLPPPVRLRLIQCLPKANKMDLIVRQSAEAGLWSVVPVISRHSQIPVRAWRGPEAERKLARWRRIAREAQQQSGAAFAPRIERPAELEQALVALYGDDRGAGEEVKLLFDPAPPPGQSLHRCLSKSPRIVTLVVGPEGGLAAEELARLRNRGFLPVTLGSTVLRSETAALYAVAAVQTVILERQAWDPR